MTYPASPSDAPASRVRPDGAQFWAGAVATAVVAALIALVGILICRWTLNIPILAPAGEGAWGNAHTGEYVLAGGADRARRRRPCSTCLRWARPSPACSSTGSWGWPRWPPWSTRSARRAGEPEGCHRGRRPGARPRDHVAARRGGVPAVRRPVIRPRVARPLAVLPARATAAGTYRAPSQALQRHDQAYGAEQPQPYPGETYPPEPGYPEDDGYRDAQGGVPGGAATSRPCRSTCRSAAAGSARPAGVAGHARTAGRGNGKRPRASARGRFPSVGVASGSARA